MSKTAHRRKNVSSPRGEPTVGLVLAAGIGQAIARSPWPLVALILGWQLLEVMGDLANKVGWALIVNTAIGAVTAAGWNTVLAWGVAVVAVAVAAWRAQLYRRQIRSQDTRIKALEDLVDRRRSSSGLTIDGRTHPDDED